MGAQRRSKGAITYRRRLASLGACLAVGALVLHAFIPPLDVANDAWRRGDYVAALNGYLQVLNGPGGDAFLEPIALTTGELYRTDELTSDGRAGRFSPAGRFIVYETGLETSRRTIVVRNDRARELVADLPGVSATFTPDDTRVAYLRIGETEDVKNASRAIEAATLTDPARNALVQTLVWIVARDSTIAVRDIASGHEIDLPTPRMLKSSLIYAAGGRTLFFLGTREGNDARTDIYSIKEVSDGPELAVDAGGLKAAPLVDPSGGALVYVIPGVSPFRRPEVGAPRAGGSGESGRSGGSDRSGGPGRSGGAGGPGRAAGAPAPPSTFAIVDLSSKRVSVVSGTAPALSRDGKTLAYVARDGSEFSLMIGPTTGIQVALKRTSQRIDRPALSPDGGRVAWQMMPRDDWEIYAADVAGPALARELRVTRDIQHDVLPRFIDGNRLIAMAGEPRHRRSYLYELGPDSTAATRIRLFHNNTVRTIAPEYEWAVSPDGGKLLVGAERDGDTVSPPRGVYLIDLGEKVTKADLIGRLRDNLRSETALKTASVRVFQPIAADVRQAVARVSVGRIFEYEKSLFDFDSKHISKPGNRLAAEYLFDIYRSFGYAPEYQWFDPSAPRPVESTTLGTGGGDGAAGAASAGDGVGPHETANVVATLRGAVNPELVYVISSHYDSVEAGPGADDDTSGTAALLEAARALAGHPLPATVIFASMTGEESGLLGSREFVRRAVERRLHVAGVLNNDMIGWMNDERMDNTIRYSNAGIRDIQHGAAMLFTKLITYDARYWKGTDAMSFYGAYGDVVGGIGSYPVLASPYYHQATDVIENVNHQLIAETSKATIAAIMLLASSPSPVTNVKVDSFSGGTASISWTPAAEKGVVSYVVGYGPASSPLEHRLTVTAPRATLLQVRPGTVVSVKAVNARGLEGWDWARVAVH